MLPLFNSEFTHHEQAKRLQWLTLFFGVITCHVMGSSILNLDHDQQATDVAVAAVGF